MEFADFKFKNIIHRMYFYNYNFRKQISNFLSDISFKNKLLILILSFLFQLQIKLER